MSETPQEQLERWQRQAWDADQAEIAEHGFTCVPSRTSLVSALLADRTRAGAGQTDHSQCHDAACNTDTARYPRGVKGVSCSCSSRDAAHREVTDLRAQVAQLQAERDEANRHRANLVDAHRALALARARIGELEAERDQLKSECGEQLKAISALGVNLRSVMARADGYQRMKLELEEARQQITDCALVHEALSAARAREETLRAETVARIAHWGQKDRVDGSPYILHVERVVALVEGDEAKAVAWLHDVVEDFNGLADDPEQKLLAAGFSTAVVDAVLLLTRGWSLPRAAPYADYIAHMIAQRNVLALTVKRADLLDHLQPSCPASLRPRYEAALPKIEAVLAADVPKETQS